MLELAPSAIFARKFADNDGPRKRRGFRAELLASGGSSERLCGGGDHVRCVRSHCSVQGQSPPAVERRGVVLGYRRGSCRCRDAARTSCGCATRATVAAATVRCASRAVARAAHVVVAAHAKRKQNRAVRGQLYRETYVEAWVFLAERTRRDFCLAKGCRACETDGSWFILCVPCAEVQGSLFRSGWPSWGAQPVAERARVWAASSKTIRQMAAGEAGAALTTPWSLAGATSASARLG